MNAPSKVIVGSTSQLKLRAVREALKRQKIDATAHACDVASGQNAQPYGYDETFRGALQSATKATASGAGIEDSDQIWFVGIESGIMPQKPHSFFDAAVVVVMTAYGDMETTMSAHVPFPADCVDAAGTRKFKTTTVGDVIAARMGGSPADPHATLTGGRVTRVDTLVPAIEAAFALLLEK